MLSDNERTMAAKTAMRFPKGNGDLFLSNRSASWNADRAATILDLDDGAASCGCPATQVAISRGALSKIGLLRALDDICRELSMTREDYCELLGKNPKKIASMLGWRLGSGKARKGA